MAGLKELMKAFLFEEVEPDEEFVAETDEVSEVDPEEDVYKGEYKPEPKPEVVPDVETVEVKAPVEEPVYWENVPAEEEQTETVSIFDGLDMDSISKPEKTKKRAAAYRYDRRKANSKVHRAQVDSSDYTAIISPIFGNVVDEEKEFDAVHDAINLPKPDADFEMTRVLSPMFGREEHVSGPVRAIPLESTVLQEDTVEEEVPANLPAEQPELLPAVEEQDLPAVEETQAEKPAPADLLTAHLTGCSTANKTSKPASYKKPSKKGRR